ncbi:MAG: site-2 protease family protein, partial [Clostridia bacterium]|nr:site-2 protease family protein [Clostridia bacterium]
ITMLVFGYGWAEPVPINTRNFKNPRVGMALTAIAGPISNFILGLISCLFETITRVIFLFNINGSETFFSVMLVLMTFFQISAILNFGFMAFNLIPLPPFDGSRFFYLFLPSKWYFKVMKYEQTIMIAVLLGCFVLSRFNYSPVSIIANSLYSYVTMLMNLVYILVSNLIL